MAFVRTTEPQLLTGDELTSSMVGIGMLFAAEPNPQADIEDTLVSASIEGMERDDLRVLSLLITWLEIHSARVNADRLLRTLHHVDGTRTLAFWTAVGTWLSRDRRFARLDELHSTGRVELLEGRSAFMLDRHGEDPRFTSSSLIVPANVLRDRKSDIASPEQLAAQHQVYRWRLMMGPSYRADVWAALEADPTLSVSEVARRTRSSIGTASEVRRDFLTLRAA